MEEHGRGVGLKYTKENDARRNLRLGGRGGRGSEHGEGNHGKCEITKEYIPSPHELLDLQLSYWLQVILKIMISKLLYGMILNPTLLIFM